MRKSFGTSVKIELCYMCEGLGWSDQSSYNSDFQRRTHAINVKDQDDLK